MHQVLLHNMGRGQGHLERSLPKAEVPRLSESIQRLYKQSNPNPDQSLFQLEKHFIKFPRAPRTMNKDLPRGNQRVTDDCVVRRMRWRGGSRYYTLLYMIVMTTYACLMGYSQASSWGRRYFIVHDCFGYVVCIILSLLY